MRLAIDRRVGRWLQRVRGGASIYTFVEIALLALIAWATAALIWTLVTPLGPVGKWRAGGAGPQVDPTLLTRFDPFGRLGGTSSAAVVTSASVKLFGVRVDNATGQGSAILAGPDGVQQSYAIGDEVAPGVKLKRVRLDGVVLDRGGNEESVFLDQSVAAPVANPTTPSPPTTSGGPPPLPVITPPPGVVPPNTAPPAPRVEAPNVPSPQVRR